MDSGPALCTQIDEWMRLSGRTEREREVARALRGFSSPVAVCGERG